MAIEHILRYAIGIIKLKFLQHLRLNKTISLDAKLRYSEKQTRYDKIESKKYIGNESELILKKIHLSEDDTAITVMEKCLLYGLNREETLQFVKNRFCLTEIELMDVLKKELMSRNNLRTTKEGKIYLADKKEGMEH